MQDYTAYARPPMDFEVLPAGGYIAKVMDVDDRGWQGHIEQAHMILMDIAEGEHRGLYTRNNQGADKKRWLSYWFAEPRDTSPDWMLSKIGGIQKALAESNRDVNVCEPHAWRGRLVGVVVGDEEAESRNGNIYIRPYAAYLCSVERIRKGENQPGGYKIPELKKLEAPKTPPATGNIPGSFSAAEGDIPDSFSAAEDDIPF